MNQDPLIGPKSKIERANRHIREAEAEFKTFFSPPPHYKSFREVDADRSREALKIKLIREPPHALATIVGDAVSNLRSALDQLVCALAIQNGHTDLKRVEFPFAGSPEEFELAACQKKIRKLSPDAADLIRAQKPYRGGNDLLWAMNEMRNADIHRALITSVTQVACVQASMTINPGIGFHTIEQPQWHPSDREITILTFTPGAELKYQLQVLIGITLRNIETLEDEHVLTVLQQFAALTERILLLFEDRFFREWALNAPHSANPASSTI